MATTVPSDYLDKLTKAAREIEPFATWGSRGTPVHDNPNAGDLTIVHLHGKWRPAVVLRVGVSRAQIAYLTPNRLRNAERHYSAAPLTAYRRLDELASPASLLAEMKARANWVRQASLLTEKETS